MTNDFREFDENTRKMIRTVAPWEFPDEENPENRENDEKLATSRDFSKPVRLSAFALHLPSHVGGVTIVAGPWPGAIFSIIEEMDPNFEMHFPTGTVKKNALGYDLNQNVYLLPER